MCARAVSGGVTKSGDDQTSFQNTCHATVIKEQTFQGNHILACFTNQKRENSEYVCDRTEEKGKEVGKVNRVSNHVLFQSGEVNTSAVMSVISCCVCVRHVNIRVLEQI